MFRLFDVEQHRFLQGEELLKQESVPYVIISHTWQEPEVMYDDIASFNTLKLSSTWDKADSAARLLRACANVQRHPGRVKHLWMDTICINQRDPSEVSTAINSMFRWYREAQVCFAHLCDYPSAKVGNPTQSRWFTRGFTLQELVAPKQVLFFDKDSNPIGDKHSMQSALTERTQISKNFLLQVDNIGYASISQRMSWSAGRKTTVPEDIAYSLLGLFGVNMPLLYGEGADRAFRRLQEEIMRYSDDHSIFAWRSHRDSAGSASGLLAPSPDCFEDAGHYLHDGGIGNDEPFRMTNKGIEIMLPLLDTRDCFIASIDCPYQQNHYLGIYVKRLPDNKKQYHRIRTSELCVVKRGQRGNLTKMYVKPPRDI
ncbi:MAG: hypothetical protein Q9162_005121 [Coniocarpon cinnabarinum]